MQAWHARTAGALVIALLGTQSPFAAAGPPTGAEDPSLDPAQAQAQADWKEAEKLFKQGSARFSAANYAAAIQDFQTALELVARNDFDPTVEIALLINLARAHRRAFEVDTDIKHLRTSLEIYRRVERMTDAESEEASEARQAVPEIEARIDEAEGDAAAGANPKEGPDKPPPQDVPAKPQRVRKPGAGLIAGGIATAVVGAGGLGLMAFGMWKGADAEDEGRDYVAEGGVDPEVVEDIDEDGKLGNTLAIVGGVVGGVLVAGGATLIALGAKKNKVWADANRSASARRPRVAAGGAGLVLRF